jgi:hypothetical protein
VNLPSNRSRFGKLPHKVARDHHLSDEGLVYVAYRATYADDKSFYSPSESELAKILSGGFGKDVRERARRVAKAAGYLQRQQPKFREGKFSYAQERLVFPEANEGDYQIVWRYWFDGTLDRKAMAALLYINAGSGRGPAFSREVAERFHWSRPTVRKLLQELCSRELVSSIRRQNSRGQFESIAFQATIKKPGDGYPGSDQSGDIRRTILHASNALHAKGCCPSLREGLSAQSYASTNLLGWAEEDHPYGWDELRSAEAGHIDSIINAETDGKLVRELRSAADGRAGAELLSPAGIYTARVLAAFVLDQSNEPCTPWEALSYVLDAIWDRIGSRKSEWLNSYALIGQRLFGAAYERGFGDRLFLRARRQVAP